MPAEHNAQITALTPRRRIPVNFVSYSRGVIVDGLSDSPVIINIHIPCRIVIVFVRYVPRRRIELNEGEFRDKNSIYIYIHTNERTNLVRSENSNGVVVRYTRARR